MGFFDILKKGAGALWNAFSPGGPSPGPRSGPQGGGRRPNMYAGGNAGDPGYTQQPNPAHNAADYQRLREDLAQQQAAAAAARRAAGPGPAPAPRPRPPQGYIPSQAGPDGTQVPVPLPQQR